VVSLGSGCSSAASHARSTGSNQARRPAAVAAA
jgi:hypothetical protein